MLGFRTCCASEATVNRTRRAPAGLTLPARARRPHGDAAALLALLALILVAVGFRFVYDDWLGQWDIIMFFLPNYGYVGDRLRSLQVPCLEPVLFQRNPDGGGRGRRLDVSTGDGRLLPLSRRHRA